MNWAKIGCLLSNKTWCIRSSWVVEKHLLKCRSLYCVIMPKNHNSRFYGRRWCSGNFQHLYKGGCSVRISARIPYILTEFVVVFPAPVRKFRYNTSVSHLLLFFKSCLSSSRDALESRYRAKEIVGFIFHHLAWQIGLCMRKVSCLNFWWHTDYPNFGLFMVFFKYRWRCWDSTSSCDRTTLFHIPLNSLFINYSTIQL